MKEKNQQKQDIEKKWYFLQYIVEHKMFQEWKKVSYALIFLYLTRRRSSTKEATLHKVKMTAIKPTWKKCITDMTIVK